MAGWVKVDRSIQEHWLWSEEPFSKAQAWIDLILYANHKEAKIMIKHRLIEIKRGQQARSEITLSKEWGWSRDKVRRFLKLLESDGRGKLYWLIFAITVMALLDMIGVASIFPFLTVALCD